MLYSLPSIPLSPSTRPQGTLGQLNVLKKHSGFAYSFCCLTLNIPKPREGSLSNQAKIQVMVIHSTKL